ncbi:Alpha/beta hydrolase fold-3 [Penicillium canariense]|uniref:Alpha/beta hydrolase fold-3 n=1 Tax=Penicillium canariense TaxID=189055 RepID=A0A9W9HZL6_9EURO|nr:Alpha/beta hydrolase fold-3 [Penicillium canariense]KAJ5160723.1 Alpha/beta hydrolase fold-3 [Penicillium canariense]
MAIQEMSVPTCESKKHRLSIPDHLLPGLDREWVTLWEKYGSQMVRADEVSIEEYRKNARAHSFTYPTFSGPPVYHVEDLRIPVSQPAGIITIRVYTPEGPGPFPVHLNFHGGGWVLGNLNTEAAWCRYICNKVHIKVIDVDYRLAPEFPYPISIYDSWEAVKWTITNASSMNINASSVSIGGLSAGGHMSAVMAHFARNEGVDLKLQLLVVPATDMRYCLRNFQLDSRNCAYASVLSYHDVPWGPLGREQWFIKYWIGEDEDIQEKVLNNDWICTPVLAPSFKNLARAHIITAEFDLERDEGEFYGRILQNAGNIVTMKRYAGMPHAFAHYNHPERGLSQSFAYIEDTSEVIRNAHFGKDEGEKSSNDVTIFEVNHEMKEVLSC